MSMECIYNQKTKRCVSTEGTIGKKIIKNLNDKEIKSLQDKCYKKVKCAVKPIDKPQKQKDKVPKKEPAYKVPKFEKPEVKSKSKTKTPTPKKSISRPPPPSISLSEEIPEEVKVDSDLCINKSIVPLLPHQKRVIKFLQDNRGVIAVHSVGSGKTLMAVTASQCFLDKYPESKIIVISPATLIDNFKKGMENYGLKKNDNRYMFYSFEAFLRESFVNHICRNNFLIVDEAHILRTEALKEKEGAKVKKVIQCSKTALKVLCLTATPIVNKSYDLENLLSIIKGKDPMKESEWNALMDNKRLFYKYITNCFDFYQNQPVKFPSKKIHEVFLKMNKQFYEEYRDIELQNAGLLSKYRISGNPFQFLQGLRTGLLKIADSAKINWTIEHVEKWVEKKQKTVIFTNFVESGVKVLGKLLEQLGIEAWNDKNKYSSQKLYYGVISGSVMNKKRKTIIEDFNQDKIDILILSSAGGVGIDLKGVKNMVILDVPWNKANLDQAIGRAVRYESHEHLSPKERHVDIWVLYSQKPVKSDIKSADMILYDIIKSKEELETQMLNIIKKVSISDLD